MLKGGNRHHHRDPRPDGTRRETRRREKRVGGITKEEVAGDKLEITIDDSQTSQVSHGTRNFPFHGTFRIICLFIKYDP